MFAYCLNNPVCRKDIPGTNSAAIFTDEGDVDHTDDDQDIHGGRMPDSNSSSGGKANDHIGEKTVDKASNPLEDISYTQKVLQQMQLGDYHSFPSVVDNYGGCGTMTVFVGGDGKVYYRLSIPGYYGSNNGSFVYIWDANNNCNHRFFEVCK